jgi:ADP-heptose:LPS heptosyltransferase
MKTRNKVHIDRLVGLPLAWSLNLAARLLGKIVSRDHGISETNVQTVAITKYVGMGSILQATPLIRSIKVRFPKARIIFVTSRSYQRLVERLEYIDEIITVDDSGMLHLVFSSFSAIAALIGERVDLFFDLEVYSAYASIVSLLSLSRNRIGLYRESAEHKMGIYTHLMYFNTRSPIRYIYLQLGSTVGCEPVEPDRLGKPRVDDTDRHELATLFATYRIGQQPYLVINPNASDLMIERRWPVERFAALIGYLTTRLKLPVLLIGSPSERAYVASLIELISGAESARVHNLAGTLSLGGLLALLEHARCLITNDTGPMHMAWALATPSVCLFGPGDPAHYGRSGAGVQILNHPVYCSPCLYETDEPPCRGNNICMQRIEVETVFASVQRIMADTIPENPSIFAPEFFMDERGLPLGRVVHWSIENVIA